MLSLPSCSVQRFRYPDVGALELSASLPCGHAWMTRAEVPGNRTCSSTHRALYLTMVCLHSAHCQKPTAKLVLMDNHSLSLPVLSLALSVLFSNTSKAINHHSISQVVAYNKFAPQKVSEDHTGNSVTNWSYVPWDLYNLSNAVYRV